MSDHSQHQTQWPHAMRAAVLTQPGGREAISVQEMPIPEPGPGEVRLRVAACALNWLDIAVRRGGGFGRAALPLIMGSDFAGTVDALGEGVAGWNAGDTVVVFPQLFCGHCEWCRNGYPTICPEGRIHGESVHGGLAEYAVVSAANLLPKPATLSFVEVASLPIVLMTAWHMLVTVANVRPGETLLIPGAGGGVASMGIQIGRMLGATVYTTTSSAEKAARAREMGAAAVFNYREQDWVAETLAATDGRGVDVVQDLVGGATWADSLRCLARNGRMVVVGSHSGPSFELDIRQIYHKQLRIMGANGGTYDEFAQALKLTGAGRLRAVVDTVLPLAQIREGHRLLEEHAHFGKVVMAVDEGLL